ncbi:MAG: NYN domain-containing protein [Verrucomicrobiae bacterium]|nr:NYN domain-containing protein [Verrucomicrobiae bacterium]MCP5539665.1 NYN domain-containing protein [Akkermansiaceae bacterium]MCP5549403.1 NYN domain-containing protein [Akkermansiaceae bacterium]
MSDTPEFLLVDGNNILHAWEDLRALHRRRVGLGHTELCRRLRAFHDTGRARVVVVFDGRGARIEEEREKHGLQIIYTDAGTTADDVIERLAAAYAKKYRLTVATDDFAEQNMVAAFGAEVLSAEGLRRLLEAAGDDWRRWVK